MTEQYSIQLRIIGKDFGAEPVSPRDIAAFLMSVEQLIASIVVRDNPELGLREEDVILGLASITQGSLINTFVSKYEVEVSHAFELATSAISTGDYSSLPTPAVDALKDIRKFNRYHATSTEFWQQNGIREQRAVVTPTTRIIVEPRFIKGTTSLYGTLMRIGGDNPPRAWLRLTDEKTISCRVKTTQIARQMAQSLYQRVGVRGIAQWDIRDMSLIEFRIEQLLPYRQTSVIRAFESFAEVAQTYYESIDDIEENIANIRCNNEIEE